MHLLTPSKSNLGHILHDNVFIESVIRPETASRIGVTKLEGFVDKQRVIYYQLGNNRGLLLTNYNSSLSLQCG